MSTAVSVEPRIRHVEVTDETITAYLVASPEHALDAAHRPSTGTTDFPGTRLRPASPILDLPGTSFRWYNFMAETERAQTGAGGSARRLQPASGPAAPR